jgi:hypothetical protein
MKDILDYLNYEMAFETLRDAVFGQGMGKYERSSM